jgi:uncharacterized membrane protein YgcG
MHVTETIDIHFAGYDSTGFLRDIPVNGGEIVKNVAVYNADKSTAVYDVIMEDSNFVSIDIGDTTKKTGETYQYIIEYDYEIPKVKSANTLYLNPIGYGWDCVIEQASVTLILPQGYKSADYFIGYSETPSNDEYTYDEATNTITATVSDLVSKTGVTFSLTFEDGVLTTPFSLTPIIVLIVAAVLFALLIIVKFLAFNSSPLTPVVNFTAPNDMDPLIMGKLIDNKVNSEDVTSLIYYWANKGYLKINLENENNPQFIRIYRNLPEGSPSYQITMYNNLFRNGDVVTVKELENKFYPTVDAVTKDVNSKVKQLYDSKSIAVSILFALLGALLMGLTPIIVSKILVSSKLFVFECLIMIIPTFIIYALAESVMYNKLKLSRKKIILYMLGIATLAAIVTVFYVFIVPATLLDTASKIIVCIIGFAMAIFSVQIISRTKDYTEKLNSIVGFRNFILFTEKDKLEAMLEENPQFYYDILPYAQVLGVTDKWEAKFAAITVQPPQWMSNPLGTYVEIAVINRSIRIMNGQMLVRMIARPSSSGMGGGGHGSFGGFGGGGHGGGGGRGR